MDSLANRTRLTGVWIFRKNLVYVRAVIAALEKQGSEHTAMLRFDGESWSQYMIPASSVAHCVIRENDRTVLTLTPFGPTHVATPNGFSWETLDQSDDGPNSLRQMRDIRPIQESVYAVGMGRMVYRRHRGIWARLDESLRGSGNDLPIAGLLTIDGCSEDAIYAGGFSGEMWHFDGTRWRQLESPTNVKIEKIRVVSPDLVVACGAAGVLLIGSHSRWRVVPQDLTKATFWGLEWLKDRFYLSTQDGLYEFDGTELSAVDLGLNTPITTSRLHAADGVLWSVGSQDITVFDGAEWHIRNLP